MLCFSQITIILTTRGGERRSSVQFCLIQTGLGDGLVQAVVSDFSVSTTRVE